ncbi:Uu.00g073920.m01.CDS01 [Anthostomella pinea]|uniref:Uu.00g073920.m01.CDS01 n=1 Tax=Anthostomella pinea TaxID=933095 RepID=A0AAI8VVC6_9PEZI|nr:Uu.00g073920.m01.CDS01 [Anthostomella pinea]
MGGVPSVPTDPNRTLAVIGAGFARTGTVSMALAFETLLDGPVCHGGTQLLGREDAYVRKWLAVYAAGDDRPKRLKALREATRGFVAIADTPGTHFIGELCELYPDAKVVCWRRDPQRWWKSMEQMIKRSMPRWLGWGRAMLIENGYDKGPGPDILEYHYDYVKKVVPKERLYWTQLGDWASLCEILEKPVPNEPFPRANDSEAVETTAKYVFRRTAMVWMGLIVVAGAVCYAGWQAQTMY